MFEEYIYACVSIFMREGGREVRDREGGKQREREGREGEGQESR